MTRIYVTKNNSVEYYRKLEEDSLHMKANNASIRAAECSAGVSFLQPGRSDLGVFRDTLPPHKKRI